MVIGGEGKMELKPESGVASRLTGVRTSVNYDIVKDFICAIRFVRKVVVALLTN